MSNEIYADMLENMPASVIRADLLSSYLIILENDWADKDMLPHLEKVILYYSTPTEEEEFTRKYLEGKSE